MSLEVSHLTVRYGSGRQAHVAVDDVSFAVPAGGTLGIVGESGSGKSSLAGAIAGLVPAAAGTVLVGSPVQDPGHPPDARRGRRRARRLPVQTIFQDPFGSLDPRMPVGASIAEAVRSTGERDGSVGDQVRHWLTVVGLDPDLATARPGRLSGGQCQRIAVARALAAEPEVLIADEISSALDVSVQGAVLNLLRRKQRELRFTLLVISHNLAVVRFLAEDVAVMYAGRIVERGPVDEVIRAPAHPYTRVLVDAVPRVREVPFRDGPELAEVEGAADLPAMSIGCRYQARCGQGPAKLPGQDECLSADPGAAAAARRNRAECFFPLAAGEGR